METQKIYLAILILALAPIVLALGFRVLKKKEKSFAKIIIGAIVVVLVFAALTVHFNFWKFHSIYVDDVEHGGKIELQRPFHWHEVYHYYIGSKYFPELGYFGTYNCVAQADQENGRLIQVDYVRNLRNIFSSISHDEALQDCQQNFRANFTPSRWDEFKKDLAFLGSIGARNFWDSAVLDAGFNPPPSSALFSSGISNLIPITSETYLLIPFLDILLLFFGAWLIWKNFGTIGLCGFLIIFGASHIAGYMWNGGSYLRYLWFFNLIVGMSFLQRKNYFLSGLFFGVSAMLRIFPVFFALGVVVHLLFAFRKNQAIIKKFIFGNIFAVLILGISSLVVFGFEAWQDFFQNIMLHKDVHYVFHIGFKKIATFASWVPNQNFHGEYGFQVFGDWNHRLWEMWQGKLWFYVPLLTFISLAAFWSARKTDIIEGSLLIGIILIFISSLPANYYYVFLALIPIALYSQKQSWRKHLTALGLFAFLIFTWVTPLMSPDGIIQNFYVCCALGVFILWWILLCLLPIRFLQKET